MSNGPKGADSTLPLAIVLGMVLGVGVGVLFGPKAVPLGVFGKLFVQLIKMMAVPLVFFSIIEAMVVTSISWRSAGKMLVVVAVNTTCALLIGLTLCNLVRPGEGFVVKSSLAGVAAPEVKPLELSTMLDSIIPTSILQPFAENNVIAVVLLSLLLGAALRFHLTSGKAEYEVFQFERIIKAVLEVWSTALGWLVALVPFAVFCVTARTVGEYGFAPFKGLAWYVCVGITALLLHIVVVYPIWIRFVAGISLRRFLSVAKRPMIYALGTNSSLATLPLTLDALDRLQVPKSASRLGACVGTNLNNDGIILYEAMAVLFVAQAYGIDLSLGEQLSAALLSLAAAIGVAGVPEAGVISLSLVLTAVGLPIEVVPLLLTVDWIIARMRSVTNVLSDMTVSIGIAALGEESRENY